MSKLQENKKYDPQEIEMGIKIESEHEPLYNLFESFCKKNNLDMPLTKNEMYKIISLNHLNEIKDYYTRLTKMEDEAKNNQKEKRLEASLEKLLKK